MANRWLRGLILLGVAAGLAGFLAWAGHGFQVSLESKARSLDLNAIARDAGLEGRVFSYHWGSSRLEWFPRLALVLGDIELSLTSGRPGPGEISGRARLDRLRLVAGWRYLWTRRLALVELDGGRLEIRPDLLPELPRYYHDPINGQEKRAVPYLALLRMVSDSLSSPAAAESGPAGGAPLPSASRSEAHPRNGGPAVRVRNLEISLASLEALPGVELQLPSASLMLAPDHMTLRGDLRAVGPDLPSRSIPVEVVRAGGSERGGGSWEARLGRTGQGRILAQVRPVSGQGQGPVWSVTLDDPAGSMAEALLDDPAGGFFSRLRWAGPWRVEAKGRGPFPRGIEQTRIEFHEGRLSLSGAARVTPLIVRGELRILPGRVDLPFLSLRTDDEAADSALVRLEWIRTLRSRQIRGRLDGKIASSWLSLAGPEWVAAGRLDCSVTLDGTSTDDHPDWIFTPRGRIGGVLDTLAVPYFERALSQGKLEAWFKSGQVFAVLAGVWGESPFRLQVEDLPPPVPDYLERVAAGTSWHFSSAWCRWEDFRLSPARFPRAGALPFWAGFAGKGEVDIEAGSVSGVSFGPLRAELKRTPSRLRIDTLDLTIAGGRIWTDPEAEISQVREGWKGGGLDLRLRAEDLDMATAQRILEGQGYALPAEFAGIVSGSLRVRRGGRDLGDNRGAVLAGSFHARRGSVRGLALQEALKRSTRIASLSVLSYDDWRMDIRYDQDRFFWDRMRVEAPGLRAEGAGWYSQGNLRAALALRLAPDTGGPVGGLLYSLLGPEQSAVYAILRGSVEAPEYDVVSRSAFLKEIDRLGAALPQE